MENFEVLIFRDVNILISNTYYRTNNKEVEALPMIPRIFILNKDK